MLTSFNDPRFQTIIFSAVFISALLLSLKKTTSHDFFSKNVTLELKGFAILAIIFGHIGYFLVSDHNFLFPLSILSGVGVNLFLFLSGFGLSVSQLQKPLNIWQFYRKRLSKILIPFWLVLLFFFLIDNILLNRTYSTVTIIQNIFGFFPRADLIYSVDSPLWYFTMIIFYYLLFPIIYIRKSPLITSIILIIIQGVLLYFSLPVHSDVEHLYRLHFIAFPLGIVFSQFYKKINFHLNNYIRFLLLITLIVIVGYTALYSGVGDSISVEQSTSLLTTMCIVLLFSFKRVEIKLFNLVGFYSYELYLLHWPIISRYIHLYQVLPQSIVTIIYLIFLIFLAYLFQKMYTYIYIIFLR